MQHYNQQAHQPQAQAFPVAASSSVHSDDVEEIVEPTKDLEIVVNEEEIMEIDIEEEEELPELKNNLSENSEEDENSDEEDEYDFK